MQNLRPSQGEDSKMNIRQDMRTWTSACMRVCARLRSGDRATAGFMFLLLRAAAQRQGAGAGEFRRAAIEGASRRSHVQGTRLCHRGHALVPFFFAPKNTPRAGVERLSRAVAEALNAPDVRERLTRSGLEPTGSTPEEFAAILKAAYERWGPVIKASGFRAND